jgi:hypothetical protein
MAGSDLWKKLPALRILLEHLIEEFPQRLRRLVVGHIAMVPTSGVCFWPYFIDSRSQPGCRF